MSVYHKGVIPAWISSDGPVSRFPRHLPLAFWWAPGRRRLRRASSGCRAAPGSRGAPLPASPAPCLSLPSLPSLCPRVLSVTVSCPGAARCDKSERSDLGAAGRRVGIDTRPCPAQRRAGETHKPANHSAYWDSIAPPAPPSPWKQIQDFCYS